MTEQDRETWLTNIQIRLDKTNVLPWGPRIPTHEGDHNGGVMVYLGGDLVAFVSRWEGQGCTQQEEDHAEFIQHSRDDIVFLLYLIKEQRRLIEIMRQDGTEAQDLTRREEKARIVAWLRKGASEFKRDRYNESEKALQSFANALESQP